jgi:HAD superfamily hydrolase (TIGR01549 family)
MESSIGVVFDLDGTLVDSVYQHVLAWHEALQQEGIELSVWRIHRKIGMSGGLFAKALLRETGRELDPGTTARLQQLHVEAYLRRIEQVRPLPGAKQLLGYLTEARIRWGIATSGRRDTAVHAVELLGIPGNVTVVTRDDVRHAKPDPDLFLEATRRLSVDATAAVIVGDSIWDMLAARRARALGVGLLSGGYGQDELETTGAYRVYEDPANLLVHLDEIGIRSSS